MQLPARSLRFKPTPNDSDYRTSSPALGFHRQVARELSRVAPINLLRPSCQPWAGGAISLHAVVRRLRDLLPPTFEDLDKVCARPPPYSGDAHLVPCSGAAHPILCCGDPHPKSVLHAPCTSGHGATLEYQMRSQLLVFHLFVQVAACTEQVSALPRRRLQLRRWPATAGRCCT